MCREIRHPEDIRIFMMLNVFRVRIYSTLFNFLCAVVSERGGNISWLP